MPLYLQSQHSSWSGGAQFSTLRNSWFLRCATADVSRWRGTSAETSWASQSVPLNVSGQLVDAGVIEDLEVIDGSDLIWLGGDRCTRWRVLQIEREQLVPKREDHES